ncbi:hypothetical protein UFOVP909_34 [uncultured Caudovirales phage]|uniref:Uncharacterized protein n=1 Tax=uncultured Caudovirales phage TaxID=2100421 RepID=A0A6J5SCM3_9CAUD|nr:hypothetical protein UFOVP909_34 [uncultured Caudovirales phage]CAB4181223.1 hypothetical protein UFOVP1066_15 [uncultured Caudovirales phage]CAB4198461.1 hypothetical protein UFOVP1315_100 [uncultured Caudovirales phage]CAB4211449.1 hypothetical protein UFOVP1421_61 [uncultured Caudovirales phage]CAB5238544.1 hypothetical protein UFOVP1525_71 [uncultured Caudovirales phage]
MNLEYEIHREGLTRTIKIKEHNVGTSYVTVEFTVKNKLVDQNGKVIIDGGHTCFFDPKEFTEFFTPIINELKARLDNADSIQNG